MDFIALDDNIRRKMIIDYVNDHELCTREEIVKNNQIPVSRVKIFNLVKELLKEGVLVEIREKINSRDHKLVVNKTSILFSVPEELEQIKNAYINVVRKFKGLIEGGSIVLDTGFVNRGPLQRLPGIYFNLTKSSTKIGQFCESYEHKQKVDNSFYQELTILVEKLESYLAENQSSFNEIRSDNSVDYIILGRIAGSVYYYIYNYYFGRSILIWSNRIHDQEALKRLLVIFYSAMTEMHVELSTLFDFTINAGSDLLNIDMFRDVDLNSYVLYYFMKFGQDKQLDVMINLLIKINSESKHKGLRVLKPDLHRSAAAFEDHLVKLKEVLSNLRIDSLTKASSFEVIDKLRFLEDNIIQLWVNYLGGPS